MEEMSSKAKAKAGEAKDSVEFARKNLKHALEDKDLSNRLVDAA